MLALVMFSTRAGPGRSQRQHSSRFDELCWKLVEKPSLPDPEKYEHELAISLKSAGCLERGCCGGMRQCVCVCVFRSLDPAMMWLQRGSRTRRPRQIPRSRERVFCTTSGHKAERGVRRSWQHSKVEHDWSCQEHGRIPGHELMDLSRMARFFAACCAGVLASSGEAQAKP